MLSLLVFILLLSSELNHGPVDFFLVLYLTRDLAGVIVVHVLITGLYLCLHEGLGTGETPIPSLELSHDIVDGGVFHISAERA